MEPMPRPDQHAEAPQEIIGSGFYLLLVTEFFVLLSFVCVGSAEAPAGRNDPPLQARELRGR